MPVNATLPGQLRLLEANRTITTGDDDRLAVTLQHSARRTGPPDNVRAPDLDSGITQKAKRAGKGVIGANAAGHFVGRQRPVDPGILLVDLGRISGLGIVLRNGGEVAAENRIQVRDQGSPVSRLNELEFIRGEVFANVWLTDRIARLAGAVDEEVRGRR